MINHFFSKQFTIFLITGGIAGLINFTSRIFYNQYCSFSASVFFAYLTGMATAFILAKIFVFKNSSQSLKRSAMIFILVNILALTQTLAVSTGLNFYILPAIGVKQFVSEIASGIGIVFPVFTSFLGHKYWSFK